MIYERERGHQYIVENGYSRPDGMGGRIVRQSLIVIFEPRGPLDPTAEFDTRRAAEAYVTMAISAGNVPYDKREEKIEEVDKRLQQFIENHLHYTRPGGLSYIWKQKTMEERADILKASIQAQQDRLREMESTIKEKSDAELEELTRPPVKDDGMAKQPGVISGAATVSNSARGK